MASGGETGIRTLGPREGTTVFETAPFDHSGTSPRRVWEARLGDARKRRNLFSARDVAVERRTRHVLLETGSGKRT